MFLLNVLSLSILFAFHSSHEILARHVEISISLLLITVSFLNTKDENQVLQLDNYFKYLSSIVSYNQNQTLKLNFKRIAVPVLKNSKIKFLRGVKECTSAIIRSQKVRHQLNIYIVSEETKDRRKH